MQFKIIFLSLIISIFCLFLFAGFSFADRGMIPPPQVQLDQSAQNAIVAWNGTEEIIILSSDVKSSEIATVLEILPLPSQPSQVKEGSIESFETLIRIINEKEGGWRQALKGEAEDTQAPTAGIEITFHEKIGAHDVTIVKVNVLDDFTSWIEDFSTEKDLPLKEVSDEFKQGLANYLKRDIKYFVFDVIEVSNARKTIEPLVYRFRLDFIYYPILISGISDISESSAEINLFIITESDVEMPITLPYSYYSYYWFSSYGYPVELSAAEIEEVSEDLSNLFKEVQGVKVRKASLRNKLSNLTRDLMLFPDIWDASLTLGSSGKTVKNLQQVLINEGVWDSEVKATGYFGPVTQAALAEFQEKYKGDILEPLDLETGTGFFGKSTREYLKKLSIATGEIEIVIDTEKIETTIKWERNLSMEQEGEDVKRLQEILIEEEVWARSDIKPTGYFGPITQQAVIRFQEKYASEILEPLGLTRGTGFVGSSTRTYLKEISP